MGSISSIQVGEGLASGYIARLGKKKGGEGVTYITVVRYQDPEHATNAHVIDVVAIVFCSG